MRAPAAARPERALGSNPRSLQRRRAASWIAAAALLAAAASADADTPALLEVVVDGRRSGEVARLVLRDGEVLAPATQWRALGLRDVPTLDALIAASALPGVRAHLDTATQTLALDQGPDPSRLTVLDIGGAQAAPGAPRSDPGAVLNYDAQVRRSSSRSTHSVLLDARAFGGGLLWEHAVIASDAGAPVPRVLRLATSVTQADPARARRARAGDLVSGALAWTRPLRLLGAQWATDFALRPDLVTMPVPQVTGQATLPSTVDVLVNGVRQWSQPVEPGRFEVRQLPVVSGAGEVSVVVRDAFGRESVQRLAFYASPRQLAAGLESFSVEAGLVRRRFGSASNDYGPAVASASWRRGLSDRTTIEAHAEGGAGLLQAGAGVRWVRPRWGGLALHGATSRAAGRGGSQAGVAVEHQGPLGGVAAQWTRTQPGYRDLAALQGDAIATRSAQMSGGFALGRSGTLGAAYVQRDVEAPASRVRLATASYSVALAHGAQIHAGVYRDRGGARSSGASLTLAIALDRRTVASVALARDARGSSLDAQASRPALDAGDRGWRVQATQPLGGVAAPARSIAEVEHLAPGWRASAGVESTRGAASALRAGAQGSLVLIDGGVEAARKVDQSLALVQVGAAGEGAAGVAVYHENRYVGRTGADGRLLVPGLLSFQPNRLAFDPLDLAPELQPRAHETIVRPGDRAGVVVRFALDRARARVFVLRDAQGRPLPLGALVVAADGGAPAVVGHDGQAYVADGGAAARRLDVYWRGARLCSATAEPTPARLPMVELSCR
ncbi:MAG TPA: fimbria/pilus outer membrane usher protein [Burkholderiaceae bacterium]|nr:fimbria/pilus outer membrane usher protein [Burkholderiaceae bacterium]